MNWRGTPSRWFIFWLLVWVSGCAGQSDLPKALKGVLSVPSWSPEGDPPLELAGEWQVVWGEIVSPQDFDAAYQGELFSLPARWNDTQRDGIKMGPYGAATFRLQLRIQPYQGDLALHQISPHAAWKLFVNQDLVGGNGQLDAADFVSHYVSRQMNTSSADSTLVLQVANYTHAYGGPGHAPTLWSKDRLDQFLNSMSLYYMFVVGVLVTLAMLHLAIFISGRQQRQNRTAHLWFSLLCLVLVYRVVGVIPIVYLQYGDQAWYGDLRPVYLSLFLAPTIYLLFFRELFPQQLSNGLAYWLLPIFVVPLVYTAFASEYGFTSLRDYSIAVNVFLVLFMGWIALRAARVGEPGAWFILASNVVFLATALNDASVYADQNNGVDLTPFGILILGVGFSLALRQQLQKTLREADVASRDLAQLNLALEGQVQERTAAFQAAAARAENSAKQQARFIAAASHDLRQPLHALGMFTTALRRQNADTQLATLMDQQERAIGSLGALLQDTLDAARVEAGITTPVLTHAELATTVNDIVATYRVKAEAVGIQVAAEVVEGELYTDISMFRRVLGNLLDNAIKAARQRVALRVEVLADALVFRIEDDGPGLDVADYERVFKPYVSIVGSDKEQGAADEHGGYGLGLHVVNEFTQQLGGRIELGVSPLGGMSFALHLNRVAPGKTVGPNDAMQVPAEPKPGMRVLALDDDIEIRQALSALLESWLCDARIVANADKLSLELDSNFSPQVLLVDFHLIGKTGLELVSELRESKKCDAPAIFITGATEIGVVDAITAQGHQVLSKPISTAELGAVLRRVQVESASDAGALNQAGTNSESGQSGG